MKNDIITFGSAAQDIHVKSKAFKILKDENDLCVLRFKRWTQRKL